MWAYNTVSYSLPAAAISVRVLGANSQRGVLSLFNPQGTVIGLSNAALVSNAGAIVLTGTPGTSVLPYRDFGPIIQNEIWLTSTGVLTNGTITEIVKVG